MFSWMLTAAMLLSAVWAAPALHKRLNDPPNVPLADAVGPPGASGALRGGKALAGFSSSNVVNTEPSTQIPPSEFELAPGQSEKEDLGLYLDFSTVESPQPIRGSTTGPTDPGPRNYAIDRENSDLFAPPGTDTGGIANAKWPMGLSRK